MILPCIGAHRLGRVRSVPQSREGSQRPWRSWVWARLGTRTVLRPQGRDRSQSHSRNWSHPF